MNSLLNARPDGFDSMEEAIEWQYVFYYSPLIFLDPKLCFSVSTNTILNVLSARVSIPSIIQFQEGAVPPYQWRTPLRSTAPYWLSKLLIFIFQFSF